ncbi:MAG: type III-A CRISPR-associated protein Csm2 [Candidatus Aenigmatarchaeota archaeon]
MKMDNRNQNRGSNYQPKQIDEQTLQDALNVVKNLNSSNVENFVKTAEKLAKENFQFIAKSKLRDFYDYVKGKELDFNNKKDWDSCKKELYLLIPKLAYQIGRAKEQGKKGGNEAIALENFEHLYSKLLEILDENNFQNFIKFFEAIVAYHKQYAG